jgi:hypothetical protein
MGTAESSSNSEPLPKPPSDRALPAASSSEKREHPRFKIEGTTVAIGKPGILASLGLGPIRHPVINLSAGGAMVKFVKRLPVDSRHPLRIEIPRYKEVIEGTGEVRWCGESARNKSEIYVGIQFVDLPVAEQRKLSSIYDLVSSAEYKAKATTRKEASSGSFKPVRP